MPRVLNRHADAPLPPDAIYVGRGTPFGNPFSHRGGTAATWLVSSRDEAIASYATWLLQQPELLLQVRRSLRGRDLVCSCLPLACHAETLFTIANGYAVAFVGSRDFYPLSWVAEAVAALPGGSIVVSGNARGVDRAAETAARQRGDIAVVSFPADWNGPHGKGAGFARNAQIVEFADRVVAFWDGMSRGTAHSIGLARDAGKPMMIVRSNGCVQQFNMGSP